MKIIIDSLITWFTIVVVSSVIFTLFQSEYPIELIFFDVLGYSILLSIPWLVLFILCKFLLYKFFSKKIYRKGLLIIISGIFCYLSFILLLFFIENEFSFDIWNNELFFHLFLIYLVVTCLSVFLWERRYPVAQ